jgi:crotonobetaine/carnitine-CoA ligase
MKLHGEELDITTVAELVRSRAGLGDKVFLRLRGRTLTYREADQMSTRFANALAGIGITKGDVVSTLLYNSVDAVLIWFACAKLGAIWNAINVSLRRDDLAYTLNDSGAMTLITESELLPTFLEAMPQLENLRHVVLDSPPEAAAELGFLPLSILAAGSDEEVRIDIRPSDPIGIIYTGGSTGMPKGVLVPNLYYIAAAMRFRDVCQGKPDDVIYESGHLFHSGGQQLGVTGPMFCEMTAVMGKWFSVSRFWETVREHDATIIHVPGTMLGPLVDLEPNDLDTAHRVRLGVGTGTGMIRREVRDEFERRYSVRLLEVWAQTEMGVLLCSERLDQRRIGSSGHSDGWATVQAVDELDQPVPHGEVGELVTRPSEPFTFMLGYINKPAEMLRTWRNLWHHTGDLGYVDQDGYVYFVGRQAHWIRRRGENISCMEVEKTIVMHPAIQECAVVGVPSELGDEDVKALVKLRPGIESPSPEALVEWCKGRIASFKVPRYIEFVQDFPRTSAKGEIERSKLKAAGVGDAWDRESSTRT